MRGLLRIDGSGICPKQIASAPIGGRFGDEGHRWLPALEWKEFIQSTVLPGRKILKHAFEPFGGVNPVQFGGSKEGLNDGGTPAGAFRPNVQPVFLAYGDGTDITLDRVIIDGEVATVGEARQGNPTLETVVDRQGSGPARGSFLQAFIKERLHFLQ